MKLITPPDFVIFLYDMVILSNLPLQTI